MNEDTDTKLAVQRAKTLLKKRKEVFSLPPEKALDRILEELQPAALVHSFAEDDLYFLIHDIGPEDALPLLALASDKQKEFILDVEVWQKDRVNLISLTRWFDLLLKADPGRFVKWCLDQQTGFVEFYLFRNIEIRVREHDQDPSEFGKDFFTHDDTFYVRFTESPGLQADKSDREQRDALLAKFLRMLANYDHVKYQQVLLEAASVVPAETEEEMYRLRNVRLAEKGFLPFDEAVGIYQSLDPQDLEKDGQKAIITESRRDLLLPVPLASPELLKEDNLFTRALALIDVDHILQQIQTEFAALCNQIIAADQKKIRDKEELRTVVKKACGYVDIGLRRIAGEDVTQRTVARTAKLIQQYPLARIFRVGYGQVLQLKWRAERWHARSWFAKEGLPLSFWGEDWLGVLGGLLIKRPLFFDNYRSGELYREFHSIAEVEATEKVLDEIIAFDDLLALMSIRVKPLPGRFLTYKNLLLTLWARNYLGLSGKCGEAEEVLTPLTLDEFRKLFDDLWEGARRPRQTRIAMKESFLNWLAAGTALTDYEISQRMGHALEDLFSELESEYGTVARDDLDPRHIHLFLLELNASAS